MRNVKWGVLGTAGILARAGVGMQIAEHCQMYAIAGRNQEKTLEFQKEYGFEKAYFDYDSLLEDPEVEAVYIPLPNTLHYEWVVKALQHKKHVLCEKPITPTEAEARKLFELAEENGVFLMEGFAYQHSEFIAAIDAEIMSGVIGDIRYIDAAYITSDYEGTNIRMRRDTLGGSTYDLGVYTTSVICRLMKQEPVSVSAVADFSEEHIDLLTTGFFKYGDNKRAAFTCGMLLETDKDSSSDHLEIHGTKGKILSQDFGFNKPGKLSYEIVALDGKVLETKVVEVSNNYALEMEQMSRCVAGEATPAVTKEFSLANARMIDGILEKIGY